MKSTETTVHIENLRLVCHVGKESPERSTPQTVLISITCELASPHIARDHMEESVDYVPIIEAVRALGAQDKKRKLIETLAAEIAEICFAHLKVTHCTISVRKPHKVSDVESVGITRTFTRSQ